MSHKGKHVKYSTENNLRKLYEREVLNLTRAGRSSEQSTFYNIFDEKVVRNRSIELALGSHLATRDPLDTSIEMFNLTNGATEALPRLEIPRGSYPDMLGALPKIQKSRLKDADLDWIANNWHKKNLEMAGKKGKLSVELSKLMIHKSRSHLTEDPSTKPKKHKSTKQKPASLIEDFSKDPAAANSPHLRQVADELEESKLLEAQSMGAGDASEADAKHTQQTTNSVTKLHPASYAQHRFYRFANSNQFYPVASQRCYELPRKKSANEGFHPYAAKLPKNISIMQRTSSDFYAVDARRGRRMTIEQKQVVDTQTAMPHPVYPISPLIILEEYYGRGTYYRNKMRDPHFQDKLQLLEVEQEGLSITDRDNRDGLTSDPNRDNEKSNSKTPANKERRLLRIGNKTKGVSAFPTVILKDKQDEFSVRKVTSIYPYKSYWLKCILTCLEPVNVFDYSDMGYYRVQPFKEQIKLDPEQMNMGEELSDWDGFEQLMQTREAMVEFSVKVELDYNSELEKLKQYNSTRAR